MNLKSKKIELLILAITALVCSRVTFALFNDPEGPNLLIVVVLAAVLFAFSLVAFQFKTSARASVLLAIALQIVLAGALYLYLEKHPAPNTDSYKNISYVIEGEQVQLESGFSEVSVPGSSAKIITRYFGNELRTDLDGNGTEDVAFIVTRQTGGSGTFYYVVAALDTANGFVGSDGYLLGDRIAPQTLEVSQNPNHKHVIVANYADRGPSDPMTAQPSVGKSAYLKIDPATYKWAIVVADFEGESR